MAAPTSLVVTETKPGAATATAPAAPVAAPALRLPVVSDQARHHRHRPLLPLPSPSLLRLLYGPQRRTTGTSPPAPAGARHGARIARKMRGGGPGGASGSARCASLPPHETEPTARRCRQPESWRDARYRGEARAGGAASELFGTQRFAIGTSARKIWIRSGVSMFQKSPYFKKTMVVVKILNSTETLRLIRFSATSPLPFST